MINKILQKSEKERSRWAAGFSLVLSLLILISFGFYKAFFNMNLGGMAGTTTQTAAVMRTADVASPIQNAKETLRSSFEELGKKYQDIKDSLSSVLVPFVSNIDVYGQK